MEDEFASGRGGIDVLLQASETYPYPVYRDTLRDEVGTNLFGLLVGQDDLGNEQV